MRSEASGPSQRQLRVGEELRHILSGLLMRGDLRDPVLSGVSITVTEVRVTQDLRHATAFVMPLAGAEEEAVAAALKRATPYLRSQMGKGLRLRHTPELMIELDQTFSRAEHMDRLLDRLADERHEHDERDGDIDPEEADHGPKT